MAKKAAKSKAVDAEPATPDSKPENSNFNSNLDLPSSDSSSEIAISPKVTPATYVVFARRFRPHSFAEVAGQMPTTGALKQALTTGRLAQAYLFCGPRGVGKTSLARILAKAFNCLNGKGPGGMAEDPCNDCHACRSIQEGRALDVIEMDAATNRGIEEIRSLRENVGLAPAELRYKVYIIDEVHMLTKEAWNAFLKTLEEPPPHVKFIFATTDPNNVPETILSRCQRYDLRRIGPADIVKRLKQICALEKVEYDEMALSRIAGLSRGGLRDAEGLLDQAVNLGQGKVTDAVVRDLSGSTPDELILDVIRHCADGQTAEVLRKIHSAIESGADPEDILSSLAERLRAALLSKVCGADSEMLEGQTHLKEAYIDLGKRLSEDQMLMLIQLFTAARRQLRDASQTRLPLEMALIRASRVSDLVELGKLVGALENSRETSPNRAAATQSAGVRLAAVPSGSFGSSGSPPAPTMGGPRPNSVGHPVGIVESRSVAEPSRLPAPVAVSSVVAGSAGEGSNSNVWAQVVAAVRAMKGGMMLASGLNFAASVHLDIESGSLKIGFAPEQLLYKEPLDRTEGRAVVQAALRQLFEKDFQLEIERVAAGASQRVMLGLDGWGCAAPAIQAMSAATFRTVPLTSAPVGVKTNPIEVEFDTDADTDEDVEFDESGATGQLALPAPIPSSPLSPLDSSESDKHATSAQFQRPQVLEKVSLSALAGPAGMAGPVDVKAVREHPLIKSVLKDCEGDIKRVTRSSASSIKTSDKAGS